MDRDYSRQYLDLWRRHGWWQARHRIVCRTLHQIVARRASDVRPTILDIGCVGGVAFADWSRLGDVYGLEPDPQLVDAVPQWRPRIEMAPFGPEYQSPRQYDLILMLDVLEHLEDDRGSLARLYQMLRPGGSLVLTVPALMWLWSAHDVANHHFRRYERRQLRSLLIAQQFQVSELRYLFGWSLGLLALRKLRHADDASHYRVDVPARPMNALFRSATAAEEGVGRLLRLRPPLGSSLLAVAHKPTSAQAAGGTHWSYRRDPAVARLPADRLPRGQ